MAQLNTKPRSTLKTHEGAPAKNINHLQMLRRSVLACMLWEKEFYEDGEEIAGRIQNAVMQVKPEDVCKLAIEARTKFKLRHVPLLLMASLAAGDYPISSTLAEVIQRPDELSEFLAIYQKDEKHPLSNQIKKGLGNAFKKFNEYQLGKYNRAKTFKLKLVLKLTHPKPDNEEQSKLWHKLRHDELAVPDTWEVALSGGADKKETWIRLIEEKKLGTLALLRNLRNMTGAGVPEEIIISALAAMNVERILPYRFIAAARYAVALEPYLELSMFRCIADAPKMSGKTVLLVDVSGSMTEPLSAKSDMCRVDAACGLAMLLREICENVHVFTFSADTVAVPTRRGFALRDAIVHSQTHSCTELGNAVRTIDRNETYDRMIILTDEQVHGSVPDPKGKSYMINVASNRNGVGYGKYIHIDGFSEAIVDYIQEYEKEENDKS